MLGFLILFPLVVAGVLLVVRNNRARNVIVGASALVIGLASVWLVVSYLGAPWITYDFYSPVVDYVCMAVSVLIAAAILYFGIKYKNLWACVLAAVQVVGSLVFEFGFAHDVLVTEGLYLDSLSLLMAFIIGVIGSGICVYALGYMEDFQAHEPEGAKDRRPTFFALMFVFLAAMFLIVFSNNMLWLFTGWESTTVCSFLLIGFTRTEEAIKNAFRQIIMNLLGGIAFLAALYVMAIQFNTLSFLEFLQIGIANPGMVVLPVTALAFAGLTKAAQMPFHTWLLGAMVAPTPTSALLHSSTMVKAGVFLLIKLAPIMMACPVPSVMVILVGGLTFLFCSFMAISQSNAKRVLAYSTIANLGLIVACAGVGTPEAVWAAAFLVLFHAIAKSLLFLCVGTAEHHIGSRDIEDMDLLFERMPRLARFMMLGILCMFIAPFGMLLAKWATLVSFAVRWRSSCFWRSAPRPRSCSGRSGWASFPASPLVPRTSRPRCIPASGWPSWSWPCSSSCAALDCPSSRGLWWNRTSTACSAPWARTSRRPTCGSPPSCRRSSPWFCSPDSAARRPRRSTSTWQA